MNPKSSSLYVQSLATGVAVLDAFTADRASMSLPEIAAAAGITRSAAQRFAFTLEALGLLTKDPISKRYSLSSSTLDAGCRYLESHPLLNRANPFLLELNRNAGETVNLAEPAGHDMIYIGRFPSPLRLLVHMPVGRRLPMYCSSAGRVYLAGLSDEEACARLEACDRVKYTPNTLTDMDALMQQVRAAREEGYACCVEEYYRGDLALSVPIYDVRQRVVAAVQLSVSATKWTAKRAIARFVPLMLETARLISSSPPTARPEAPYGGGAARDLPVRPPGRTHTQ